MIRLTPFVVVLLSAGVVSAAENPLPPEALDFELSDAQKKTLAHFQEDLEPNIKAMQAACGEYPVVVRWAAFFANHDLSDGLRFPIAGFIRRCGDAIDGLTQACQLPQGPAIRKQVQSVECRYEPNPRVPRGDTSKGAWEPLLEGTDLSFSFADASRQATEMVLGFLQRKFPDDAKRDWEGESLEQKKAVENATSFQNRQLEEWKYACKTAPPKVVTGLEGLPGGDPHRNRSTAVRVDDETSKYFHRCYGAIDALTHLCRSDTVGAAALALKEIDCNFVDTEDGYQKGPKHCVVKVRNGTVLAVSCGWSQSTSQESVCEALGGGAACRPEPAGPEATGPDEPAVAKKKKNGERCSSDSECTFNACLKGSCSYPERAKKKGRGEPCKHYGECLDYLSCVKGRCD